MKRHWRWILVLGIGCGDDEPQGSASAEDGGTARTGTTSATSTSSATATGTATQSGTAADSTGESGIVESTGTATGATDSTTTAATDDTSGASEGTTGGEQACLPAGILAALDQHVHDLTASAELLAGHPSENEVTGFLHAPGLPQPPALPAQFAGPLVMTCSQPLLYDPFCEEGRCSQIECTGAGAGWIDHLWVQPAFMAARWSIDEATVDSRWDEGDTGTTFDIATTSTGPAGTDMSMTGNGTMDTDGFTVTETYPAMHPAGPAVLTYADDPGGFVGQLAIGEVVVAQADAAGHLQPTGDCP